jgi:hypothetical protein
MDDTVGGQHFETQGLSLYLPVSSGKQLTYRIRVFVSLYR